MKQLIGLCGFLAFCAPVLAWDYEGHRVANELAVASLPSEFPSFIRTPATVERIAFLGGEPDRWRNTPDLPLKHLNNPDHYIDIEELGDYGMDPAKLPIFRFDFVAALALYRQANPAKFPAGDNDAGDDRTRNLVGMLPWGITENYGKLKSGFSYLKAFEEQGGTASEIANAQANIIYIMGVLGHLVADATQPLHTTVHHHGWVGPNPNGYTTNRSFHSWIDGGYFAKVGGADLAGLRTRLRPARLIEWEGRPARAQETFRVAMQFLLEQHRQLEPLYRLEQEGRLSGNGAKGLEGKAFLETQLLIAGQMLGDLVYTAWKDAPPDSFLIGQLKKRQK